MKTRNILLCATLLIVLILTGCGWLTGLDDRERAAAFIETANASPRSYTDMRDHFSSAAPNYSSINTEGYWEGTFFAATDQSFSTSGLSSGGEVAGIPGTSSLVGKVSSENATDADITFGFVPDETSPNNRLIRVIIVDTGVEIYTYENNR